MESSITQKSELAAVFEGSDLDMIRQALELYGSPYSEASSSSSSSSATSYPSSTESVETPFCQLYPPRSDLPVYEYANRPYINSLPPELLVLIFAHCILDDPDSIAILAQICWSWNDVASSTASLWQHVSLNDTTSDPQALRRKVNLWTTRSAALPIDFDITSDHRDAMLPMLSFLAESAQRWRRGTFKGRNVGKFRCYHEENKSTRPGLSCLSIGLLPTGDYFSDLPTLLGPEDDSPTREPIHFEFGDANLTLSQIHLDDVYALSSPEYLAPFRTVTRLIIHNKSDDMEMPVHEVVQVLKAFPVLETLDVGNIFSQDPNHPGDEMCRALKPVVLPYLRYMSIMSLCSLRCLLSLITTPVLTNLSLIHLNTSNLYDTNLPGEPGDSDDETHDFSQSPWTDHATGMGLRSLFSRCTPPLRVLIMDYADMRTKDFRWAFRTFRLLEHLRIIASDMSDNVARALEPNVSMGLIPLPSLKTFHINHCQKLSGAAFMRMVDKRLEAAGRGEIGRLLSAKVVDCMWFSSEQHQALATKMSNSRKSAVREELMWEDFEKDAYASEQEGLWNEA